MTSERFDSSKTRLHFSDGVLEVENEPITIENVNAVQTQTNPANLTWLPWAIHYTSLAGNKTLQACDYLGESLASFLGITTPKYQFEINEYNRQKQQEEDEAREKDAELGSWATEKITDQVTFKPPEPERF